MSKSATLFQILAALVASAPTPDQIDPVIYAKIFEVNKPCWEKLAGELSSLPSGSRVLDIGAGPGEPTTTIISALPDKGFDITCTDFQAAMVQKAEARATKALGKSAPDGKTRVEFVETGLMELSAKFPAASFDAAVGSYCLMFVPDLTKGFQSLATVLKPGAFAYFSVWKDLPFFSTCRDALEEVYTSAGGKGEVPPFSINPLALGRDERYNTKGMVKHYLRASHTLALSSVTELSYDFGMGTLDETCEATMILAASLFPKLSEDTGKPSEALKAEYCNVLKRRITANPEWERTSADGTVSWVLGKGTAMIFKIQKAVGGPSEL